MKDEQIINVPTNEVVLTIRFLNEMKITQCVRIKETIYFLHIIHQLVIVAYIIN